MNRILTVLFSLFLFSGCYTTIVIEERPIEHTKYVEIDIHANTYPYGMQLWRYPHYHPVIVPYNHRPPVIIEPRQTQGRDNGTVRRGESNRPQPQRPQPPTRNR